MNEDKKDRYLCGCPADNRGSEDLDRLRAERRPDAEQQVLVAAGAATIRCCDHQVLRRADNSRQELDELMPPA
jgi:hypothetical protein